MVIIALWVLDELHIKNEVFNHLAPDNPEHAQQIAGIQDYKNQFEYL
jgi:hypothetical protein